MSNCGCNKGDIQVLERAPEGFRAFTRGAYRSESNATKAAKRARQEGQKNVVVVHNRETAMYEESWIVGHAPIGCGHEIAVVETVETAIVVAPTSVAKESVEAVGEDETAGKETVEAVGEAVPGGSPRLALPPYESFVIDACSLAPFYELRRVPEEYQKCFKRAHAFGKVTDARRGFDLLYPDVIRQDQEVFYVAALDTKVYCRGVMWIHKGVRDATMVSAPIVLQAAFAMGAMAVLVAHGHPSGVAHKPSQADIDLTDELKAACAAAKMGFFDHLVIGVDTFYSFTNEKAYKVHPDGSQSEY